MHPALRLSDESFGKVSVDVKHSGSVLTRLAEIEAALFILFPNWLYLSHYDCYGWPISILAIQNGGNVRETSGPSMQANRGNRSRH